MGGRCGSVRPAPQPMAKILENNDNPRRRRLDCPAFRRALETGQTKRRTRQSLYGCALNGHF